MKVSRVLLVVLLLATLSARASAQIGPEFQVNTYTPSHQSLGGVAADAAGNFVAVWRSTLDVVGQRFDSAGSALGGEFQVNAPTSFVQNYPAVAVDAAGGFVVVWRGYESATSNEIFGRRYDSAGSALGAEFQVNTYTTGLDGSPDVAVDGVGNVVVVWWSEHDGDSGGIFGRRYDSAGSPLGAEFQVNADTTGGQALPAVAADAAGNVVVVWNSSQEADVAGIFGRRFDSTGSPLGGDFQVNTYTTDAQFTPDVAADGAGNFVVVWRSTGQDGAGQGVFGQRYDSAGSALGGEFQVNTYTTGDQDAPAVAADGAGNFVTVWRSTDQDGDEYGTFGQRYDSTGSPIGGEFPVNGYAPGSQVGPVVAASDAGFVALWDSENQDGDGFGVFGQRFDAAGRQGVMGKNARLSSLSSGQRTVEVRAKEPWSNGVILGDPITYGATVRVIALGDSDQDQTFTLPPGAAAPGAPGWKVAGTGWTYTDPSGVNGPVRRANLRQLSRRTLFVQARIKGSASSPPPGVALVPPGNGTEAGLVFTTLGPNGGTYCVDLGGPSGGTVSNSASRFMVRTPTTEAGCPSP